MSFTYLRRAAIGLALVTAAGCTVKSTQPPPLTGPSGLALQLQVNAIPDALNQDGGSQSSIKITAVGPDGKGLAALPVRLDMFVNGIPQDFGSLSARSVVTGSDGTASAVYTAPPSPANGVFGICSGLPGNCVSIVATPTSSNFATVNPEQVTIRLVPTGVILPPAGSPTAAFTVSPTPATAGVALHFDASSSQPGNGATVIANYAWNFGDGTTDSGKAPTHTFSAAGSFTVTLTVTNDRALTGSTTQSITVGTPSPAALPTPVFTTSPAAPGVNETVFFNGSTSTAGAGHTIASYRWTFGDGGTATGVAVSHAYLTAGTYIVQLTVADETGQSATSTGTNITVGTPPSPSSNFTFSPSNPVVSDNIVFDASTSSTAQGATITNLAWNFGDSTPIISCPGDSHCNGTRIISHAYTLAGVFVVNLVITDSAGRTASHSTTVTVGTGNPQPVITVSPTTGTGGATLFSFSSAGTTLFSGATIASYSWTFGDGGSSILASPTHTFPAGANTYTVRLTITDSQGRVGSVTITVTVT